ncbi:MAG TPA: MurT ligase domain-containing protein [Dehalococcoidia bacterium]|nr:MurT ligase domain-containing protein [Dehalococcoidia bacterium]
MTSARTIAAIAAGKLAGSVSRILRRGGGTAVAGLAALRVDPHVVHALAAQAGAGAIAITGTNGKTTTSLMLSRIAAAAGLRPLHNRSGSNLMRGVAAMLVGEATLAGRIPDARRRVAILEVDEATLPEIVREGAPRVIVVTNLFRDQLDRYGEVDAVAQAWERGFAAAGGDTTMVLNADDPAVAHLGRGARTRVIYYGIDDTTAGSPEMDHASDFRTCLDCGGDLAYDVSYYGHIGHWRCTRCDNRRPQPDVRITRVTLGEDVTSLAIAIPDGTLNVRLPLAGLYNAYNALAAVAGSLALGLPRDAIVSALEGFSAAFGRQERFQVGTRAVQVLLGKNPTGLNQVLHTVAARPGPKHLLFFLNDGIADGRDVSWIWDTDYETLQPQTASVLAAGTRAEDLALRLKYAGYGSDIGVEHDTAAALRRAVAATPEGGALYVLPTYTAMLEVRELLAKNSGAAHFWEGA